MMVTRFTYVEVLPVGIAISLITALIIKWEKKEMLAGYVG